MPAWAVFTANKEASPAARLLQAMPPEWMAARNNQLEQLHRTFKEMEQAEQPNSAMIIVANGRYRGLGTT